ncbi:MAG: hypothetical protein NTX97_08345 [Bacteroidetes bacterium]|nr:hypothetical protein [Bacteroidota bacterium]
MALSKYKILISIIFCISLVCCSTVGFKLTVEDETLAKTKWDDSSLEQLNAGYKLYVAKCGGCHFLRAPNRYPEKRWLEILPIMDKKAKLSLEQSDLIMKYVITKSYTGQKKK